MNDWYRLTFSVDDVSAAKHLEMEGHFAAWTPCRGSGLSRAAGIRTRRHHQDAVRRLFSDRLRLMKWTRAQGVPVGVRGSGATLAGRLGAGDHQSRSHPLRPVVRALSQSRTHLDAGLRHRFLPGTARRSREICARQIWPRQGRPYHRAGFFAGARRGARCGPCPADAAGACRPHRQADPQSARQACRSARRHRKRAPAAADRRTGADGRAAVLHRGKIEGFIAMPPPIPPAW